MDPSRTYAMQDGPVLVEVRIHPDFVDWAGQNYAVVALADDPNPARPTWAVIDRAEIVGPWRSTPPAPPPPADPSPSIPKHESKPKEISP